MMNVIHSLKTMAAKTTLTALEMAQVFKTQTAGMAAVEDKVVIEKGGTSAWHRARKPTKLSVS